MRKLTLLCVLLAVGAYAVPQAAKPVRAAKGTRATVQRAPAKPQMKARTAPVESAADTAFRRTPYVGAISADAATGRILFADHSDQKAYPASVTKLMTALLVLEDVEAGKYALTDRATATALAANEQPSGVGIRPGESMTVDDLLMALLVRSANDAAVMLGEHAAKGELMGFITRMNARAQALGMTHTHYDSPNGLPPYGARRRPKHWRHGYDYSTAADLLKLAREVVRHPAIFKYTSTKIAEVTDGAGKPLRSVNHNNILVKDKQKILNPEGVSEVDGLKTGYIDAGGSSIILSGTRNGKRAIVVVVGSATSKLRDAEARRLMVEALDKIAGPFGKAVPSEPQAAQPTRIESAPIAVSVPTKTEAAPKPAPVVGTEPAAPAPAPAPTALPPAKTSSVLGVVLCFLFAGLAGGVFFWVYRGFRR